MTSEEACRRASAAMFGNEKTVEVVLALADSGSAMTAQDLARATGISHGLIRDVLVRLTAAGVLIELPRLGGTRSPRYVEPTSRVEWTLLVQLASALHDARGRSAVSGWRRGDSNP